MRPFALVPHIAATYSPPAPPSVGEEIGLELSALARVLHEQATELGETQPYVADYRARKAAILYHLAADSFELAASSSIGHSRADRYLNAAKDVRQKAEALEKGETASV